MPAKSIEPLKKCTVDLFEADVAWLHKHVSNFSEYIRDLVHENVMYCQVRFSHDKMRKSLKDLPDGR